LGLPEGWRTWIDPWRVAPWLGVVTLVALWPRKRLRGESRHPPPPAAFEAWQPGRGRAAVKPAEIPARGWWDIAWRTWNEAGKDRLHIVAAGVAFYVLLALFPALAAFVALYGIFSDVSSIQEQLRAMALLLPPGVIDVIGREMIRLASIHHASLSTAFIISLLISLWSANAGTKALFDGLNIAYDEAEKRNYFKRTFVTYAFTFAGIGFVLLVAGVMVGAPLAFAWIGLSSFDIWWLPVLQLILYGFTICVFSVVYRFGPSRQRARWRWVSWGGAFAATAWMVGSAGFSAYVTNFAQYEKTYGSLGAFIGFLVWLWFLIFMVLLGAELNSEVERQTAVDTTTGRPLPIGARGAIVADTIGPAIAPRNAAKIRRRPQHVWAQLRPRWSRRRRVVAPEA
jgi:membrane protein